MDRRLIDNGQLTLDLDQTSDRRILAVTGFAVRTTQPTDFTVTAESR